jgi:hypothetical protein
MAAKLSGNAGPGIREQGMTVPTQQIVANKPRFRRSTACVAVLLTSAAVLAQAYGRIEYSPSWRSPIVLRLHGWPFEYLVRDPIPAGWHRVGDHLTVGYLKPWLWNPGNWKFEWQWLLADIGISLAMVGAAVWMYDRRMAGVSWRRWSLRAAFVGLTAVCIGLAWIAHGWERLQQRAECTRAIQRRAEEGDPAMSDVAIELRENWISKLMARLGWEDAWLCGDVDFVRLDAPKLREWQLVDRLLEFAVVENLIVNAEHGPNGVELPSLVNGHNLAGLDIDPTALTDGELRTVAEISQLRRLSLRELENKQARLLKLNRLERLESLELSQVNFDAASAGEFLRGLPRMPRLHTFVAAFSQPDAASIEAICQRGPNLREVDLEFADVTDEMLAGLAGLTGLRVLNFGGTKITDAGLRQIGRIRSLRWLDLSGTEISGDGLRHLAELRELETLYLNSTDVTDDAMAALLELENCRELDIRQTRVRGPGLRHLKGLPQLINLRWGGESVLAEGLAHLAEFRGLRRLTLEILDFSGAETTLNLMKLQQLEQLDIWPMRYNETAIVNWIAKLSSGLPNTSVVRGPRNEIIIEEAH